MRKLTISSCLFSDSYCSSCLIFWRKTSGAICGSICCCCKVVYAGAMLWPLVGDRLWVGIVEGTGERDVCLSRSVESKVVTSDGLWWMLVSARKGEHEERSSNVGVGIRLSASLWLGRDAGVDRACSVHQRLGCKRHWERDEESCAAPDVSDFQQ